MVLTIHWGGTPQSDGNEVWCGLKKSSLMLRVKPVVILTATPGILKHGGGTKMWMWLCLERGSFLLVSISYFVFLDT